MSVAIFLRLGYAPMLLVGANGLGIALAARGASKPAIAGALGAVIALSFCAERVLPYQPSWNHPAGDSRRDVAHALVNEGSILLSLLLLPLLAGSLVVIELWPTDLPFVAQVLLAVLVADLGITIGHLLSHRLPALWRLHAVHHSVTRFYGLNGLMKHPLHQSLELVLGVAPLLALGIPPGVLTALAFCTAVQLLLQHSNVDYTVGPLRRVLATNEAHRFHHLRWPGVGDVNFGLFTCLWDHLLGTWSYDPGRRFTSEQLGIDAEPDFPVGYLAQLRHPFRRATQQVPA
jgi:sterol desaturase/sphingolipid hydroxylase (fatty acid hydroxylase superfamily)